MVCKDFDAVKDVNTVKFGTVKSNWSKLDKGSIQMLCTCLNLKKSELLVIIYEKNKQKIIDSLKKIADFVGAKVISYNIDDIDDFGPRPISSLPSVIVDTIVRADVSVVMLDKLDGELLTLRRPLKQLCLKHTRHANCPGINEEIMRTGMAANHEEIFKFSKKVFNFVIDSKEIVITTDAGTHLRFNFDKQYRWINSDGNYRDSKQSASNLPGAEVFTYPASVDGVAVIDGLLGGTLVRYGLLRQTPLILTIDDGSIVDVKCENKDIENGVILLLKNKNATKIGELGIGTNIFIKDLIGVMLQDEKFPSAHIAFGNPYPQWTNAPYSSNVHIDCIMLNPTIIVDGKKLMNNGKYLI